MSRSPRLGKGEPAARVIEALRSLGTADGVRAVGIRTADLCKLAQVDAQNLARITKPLVESGQVTVCKVSTPGRGGPTNEYRLGGGMATPAFKPLDTKRAGIAHGAPTRPLPVTTPAPKVSTPRPGAHEIEVPVLGRAQPAVASNSGSSATGSPTTTPSPGVPAVAAQATPELTAGAVLRKEPTTRKAPAGDVPPRPRRINGNDGIALRIDHDGTLLIATDEGVLEIDPKQSRRLGHFMGDTHGVWNPF